VFAVIGNADGSAAERASLRAAETRPSSLQVVLIERSRKQYAVTVIRDDALPTSAGLTIPLRQFPLDPLAIDAHPTGLGALTQRRLVLREARLARTATLGQRVVDMYTHFSMISLAFAVRLLLAFQESPAVGPGMEDSAARGKSTHFLSVLLGTACSQRTGQRQGHGYNARQPPDPHVPTIR
jgi:hypothetical protein